MKDCRLITYSFSVYLCSCFSAVFQMLEFLIEVFPFHVTFELDKYFNSHLDSFLIKCAIVIV